MKIEPFKAFLPDLIKISDNDVFFSSVSDRYLEFKKKKYFSPTEKKALYAYKISSQTGNYLGLIAANSITDIANHHILPHEKTIASKEIHLQNLLSLRQAQIKPVLCAFNCPSSLSNYLSNICSKKPPVLTIPFEGTNELHQVWSITDQREINFLVNAFQNDVDNIYIADGHHRCTAVHQLYEKKEALNAYPENLLVILLPITDLKIYEYNRVIDFEHAFSSDQLLEELERMFHIKIIKNRVARPKTHSINILLNNTWHKMSWRKEYLDKVQAGEMKLDTYLFNKYIINQVFGIEDVRRDNRITYVPGIYGVPGIKLMVGGDTGKIGFMLPKIKKSELMNISNHSLTMPPKSTWFEPRIKNGIVVYPFTNKSSISP